MKKIAIVGCGGINSWVVKHINEVSKEFGHEQTIYIKLFDNDQVEEKNLLRSNQNFKLEDLMQEKAEALGNRFKYDFECVFITEDNIHLLEPFDDIIVGVDNHKVRQMLYKFALENHKYLLDMRAQGTQLGYYVIDHTKDIKYYNEKFFNNPKVMERKGSCQLKRDVENDHIENANKIIAYMGIYGIYLKRLRNEELSTNEWKFIY